jgi:succinate dehydrogenase/fumarate reductase flavoprotein subunit
MFEEKAHREIDTDVLVVGGGLGGCMVAIKASELGAKVSLIEKAALRRAGGAVLGLGRTLLVHPDYNVTAGEFARKSVEWGGGIVNEDLPYTLASESLDRVKELESWNIKLRGSDGKYQFKDAMDIVPIPNIVLRVWAGTDLQPLLAEQVRKRNIEVLERTTLTGILVAGGKPGGRVIGATAVNVRDGTFIVFRAKSICLCAGGCYQSYRWINTSYAPDRGMRVMGTKFGEGTAAAYRAGADIVNLEFTEGPDIALKDFFAHAWNLTQFGPQPLLNTFGKPLPPGPVTFEAIKAEAVEGKGPLHFDMRGTSAELKKKIDEITGYIPETFAMDLYTTSRKLDMWRDPVEFEVRKEGHMHGGQAGIGIDANARTNVPGLFAAGDTTGGGHKYSSMGAWVFGARAGKNAAEYARAAVASDIDASQVEAEKSRIFAATRQQDGYQWFEMQDKVRQIVTDYAFLFRSEAKLKRGLERLQEVRTRYLPQIIARTPRELMRCLEVQSLFTIAELHMRSALFRKESRFLQTGFHYRIDYPERDDKNWTKQTVIRNIGGEMKITAREPVRL